MKIGEIFKTVEGLYVKKESEKGLEELCRSLELKKGQFNSAIVILGSGFNKFTGRSGREHIKGEFIAHMREAAVAIKFKELEKAGLKPVIIVSGGGVYGKENTVPTLADLTKSEMVKKYGIDPEKIIVQPFSVDTSQEARHNSAVLESLGFLESSKGEATQDEKTFILTNDFHSDRASLLFKRHCKGKIFIISAEQILTDFIVKLSNEKEKFPYKAIVEKFLSSNVVEEHRKRQGRMLNLTKLPMGEQLIEFVANYLRVYSGKKEIPDMHKK